MGTRGRRTRGRRTGGRRGRRARGRTRIGGRITGRRGRRGGDGGLFVSPGTNEATEGEGGRRVGGGMRLG